MKSIACARPYNGAMNFNLNLPELHSLIWDELRRGASPTRSPFTIWQLATLGLDGAPQLRSVVLREADATAGSLCFHTDLRSPKLAEIRADGRVAMLAVDLERHLQLRVNGVAQVVQDAARVRAMWTGARPHTLILYKTPHAPGTPVVQPEDAHVQPHVSSDGVENFALVEVRLERIEWLDLTPDQHRRARFVRGQDQWQGQWIAP
ncbi:pyridoxamine 5'-phosphate oxidase family protein [Herbaspirillum huttiense F1]|uniref:pyridoxamine 5'-phosphate oxidase family protein n=1 Tax=Herbaspirillum huttiense TaxID=863372 RepID=UPI0028875197|nr:pyridoxamine 5'-phosphate oxidase family protein [Herbaspirillum huttiense]MDT0358890.1 pyridoxamine 5'-phosphate oxidase family protein [Herbaspirillum huttiense F1]